MSVRRAVGVYMGLVMRIYMLLVMRVRGMVRMSMTVSSMVVPHMVVPAINSMSSIITILSVV
jgi:hypothetical protein